jgi:HSP20 family protein
MANTNLTSKIKNKSLNPWSSLRDEMSDFFDRFSQEWSPSTFGDERFIPKIEVKDEEKSYEVCAEIPGMNEKDINITLKDNQLILEGEKKQEEKKEEKGYFHSEFSYGRFYRAIPLEDDVDEENVSANYENGVLKISLEKLPESKNKSRKIEIGGGGNKSKKH